MIKARVRAENPDANLKSYYETYTSFDWQDVKAEFYHTESGAINIVWDSIDKWANDPTTRDNVALIYEKAGVERAYTFNDLKIKSSKWANLLTKYGFKIGHRVFILLPTSPEIYFAMLACARLGLIYSILYPNLSGEELEWRLRDAEPRGIITDNSLVSKLPKTAAENVKHILLVSGPRPGIFRTETELDVVSEHMPEECETRFVSPETSLYLLYTSGSTGPPKGVVHGHRDMYGIYATAKYVLDLSPSSVLWTDGPPAWVTGAVYGTFGPWLCGAASVIQATAFRPGLWYRTLERHSVTNWYTTPLTIRKLMSADSDLVKQYDLTKLKHIATVGETLTPDSFYWIREHLKRSPHDTWWMTETGMICIANFPSQLVKPGSMGRPVPGVQAAIIDGQSQELSILTFGELALKVGWPAMALGIWKDDKRYAAYFKNGWFMTGDMAIKDEEGYYYHMGRNDDMIKIGTNFVGPYDFEQVLRSHMSVSEAAVIATSIDPGPPTIKAFIKLEEGFSASGELKASLIQYLKNNLHCEATEIEIAFVKDLPRTRSGKMLRRVLRAWELGLPSGDPLNLQD